MIIGTVYKDLLWEKEFKNNPDKIEYAQKFIIIVAYDDINQKVITVITTKIQHSALKDGCHENPQHTFFISKSKSIFPLDTWIPFDIDIIKPIDYFTLAKDCIEIKSKILRKDIKLSNELIIDILNCLLKSLDIDEYQESIIKKSKADFIKSIKCT